MLAVVAQHQQPGWKNRVYQESSIGMGVFDVLKGGCGIIGLRWQVGWAFRVVCRGCKAFAAFGVNL